MANTITAGNATNGGTAISSDTSGTLELKTGSTPTTAIAVDASQNVGIGTSSPAMKLDVNGITGWQGGTTGQTAQIVGASSSINGGGNLRVLSNTTQAADAGGALTFGGYYTSTTLSVDFGVIRGAKENSTGGDAAGYLAFGTRPAGGNNTERMRIDSSGNLLVGTTATNPVGSRVNGLALLNNGAVRARAALSGDSYFGLSVTSGVNLYFYTDNGSAFVTGGNIATNGATTAYNATSDYRLKTNIQPLTSALSRVSQLRPVTWTWKEGYGGTQPECEGFIAHELQEVLPIAVTGEKDAVDADGKPQYQGIDTSFLVATLTAAIQELKAELDATKAEVAALKGA